MALPFKAKMAVNNQPELEIDLAWTWTCLAICILAGGGRWEVGGEQEGEQEVEKGVTGIIRMS